MVEYWIGIDGGGTGTRAVIAREDRKVLGRGAAGPSALSQGRAQAWQQIEAAIRKAFQHAGIKVPPWKSCALAMGLSGASHEPWQHEFLSLNIGFDAPVIESDAYTMLLGAHAGKPGVIIAAGTGSVGAALWADGTRRLAGGWGFPVGDEGSGAWLGLQAVLLAQAAIDGRCPAGALVRAIWHRCGEQRDTLQNWCLARDEGGGLNQGVYASLAPLVFDTATDDVSASNLILSGANELAKIAYALDPDANLPLAVSGSIGQRLANYLPDKLKARLRPVQEDAATGALHLLTQR